MAKHSAVATLWANKVMSPKSDKTFEDVPARLKDEVKEILIERGYFKEEKTNNPTTEESGNTSTDETNKPE